METPTHTAPPVVSTALFIPLRREWFEAFRKGYKTFEYRPYGARWNEKTCRIGRKVTLSLGYGKQNRMHGEVVSFEKSEDVTGTEAWKSCYEGKGHTHAAKIGIRILGMNAGAVAAGPQSSEPTRAVIPVATAPCSPC